MKLYPITIIVCGLMLMLICLDLGFFMHWSPEMNEASMDEAMTEQYQAQADLLPKAQKRKALAQQMVIDSAKKWESVVVDKTPPKGLPEGIDLSENAFYLTVDTPKFRNAIQRAVNNQMRVGGVTVLNGPAIPSPDPNASANSLLASFYNYPTLKSPVVIFDLGTVTVQGTSKQIFANVRAWSKMPHYLAVADGLRINGTSPQLVGTYQLTIVGFIRGGTVASGMSEGPAATSNTSPFGGMGGPGRGGPPGGIPGVPGGAGGKNPPPFSRGSIGGPGK